MIHTHNTYQIPNPPLPEICTTGYDLIRTFVFEL